MAVETPLDDWAPPASDFRPIVAYGAQIALLIAALTVLALYHPDSRIVWGGLFLGVVSTAVVLSEAIPLQPCCSPVRGWLPVIASLGPWKSSS